MRRLPSAVVVRRCCKRHVDPRRTALATEVAQQRSTHADGNRYAGARGTRVHPPTGDGRTTATGHGAKVRQRRLTDPSRRLDQPVRPRDPTTSRSAASATSVRTSHSTPSTVSARTWDAGRPVAPRVLHALPQGGVGPVPQRGVRQRPGRAAIAGHGVHPGVHDVQLATAQPGFCRGEPQCGARAGRAVDTDHDPTGGLLPQDGAVRGVVIAHDDHRSPGVLGALLTDRAQDRTAQTAPATGADHQQPVVACAVDQLLGRLPVTHLRVDRDGLASRGHRDLGCLGVHPRPHLPLEVRDARPAEAPIVDVRRPVLRPDGDRAHRCPAQSRLPETPGQSGARPVRAVHAHHDPVGHRHPGHPCSLCGRLPGPRSAVPLTDGYPTGSARSPARRTAARAGVGGERSRTPNRGLVGDGAIGEESTLSPPSRRAPKRRRRHAAGWSTATGVLPAQPPGPARLPSGQRRLPRPGEVRAPAVPGVRGAHDRAGTPACRCRGGGPLPQRIRPRQRPDVTGSRTNAATLPRPGSG
jgi:hypothetical protein